MNQRQTWPLWQCISDKAIMQLILYQWDNYGQKLHLMADVYQMADVYRDVESLEEIDRLMRQRPRYLGKVWSDG